jgi:Zn-finger nucleic acid-binding protein
MSERQGVEIDYCPACRGVWLDRGELDKLLERSASREESMSQGAGALPRPTRPDFVDSDFGHRSGQHGHQRRKSWLSEIFD